MRILIIILLSGFLFSCNTQNQNPYNESDYVLIKTDSFRGVPGTRYFTHKKDTSRKLQIEYYDNSKMLAKGFTHYGKMDGRFEYYSYQGELLIIDSFKDGKKIYSRSFTPRDTSIMIFKDGKLSPLDASKNIVD